MVVDRHLEFGNTCFSYYYLMDSGATGLAFFDKSFALKHHLPLTQLENPIALEGID